MQVRGQASVTLLGVVVALSSAGSMALEIVAGRMLAPFVGMSLYSWTAVIAVVLAGLSLGHWIGGLRADRAARPEREAALWLAGAALGAAASLTLLRPIAPFAVSALGPIPAILALTSALFFLPSLAVGAVSPILTRLAVERAGPERAGQALGAMFALGAAGAILGTLAAGFLMISWLGSARSVFLIAALYLGLGAALLWAGGARKPSLAAAGAALLAALGASPAGEAIGAGRLGPLCDVESAYYCLKVDPAGSPRRPARLLALDHLAHGVNEREDPTWIQSPYLHLIDEIVAKRVPGARDGSGFEAYFIGGGAFTLPRAWLARYPAARMATAEIDPAVTRIAHQRLWLPEDPRHEILAADARAALAAMPPERRFDVIVGDAFHDVAIPQHLVTDEFNALVKARLRPGGIYLTNVVEALRRPPFLTSYAQTLSKRFASVELWLLADDLAPQEKRVTWIVVASDQPVEQRELRSAYGPLRVWLRPPTQAMIDVVPAGERAFLTDDHTPVDRLMSHILTDKRLSE